LSEAGSLPRKREDESLIEEEKGQMSLAGLKETVKSEDTNT